ncbi:MAG: hypothetical protein ABSH30_00705 [Acidimicrobiales bacterium]|jgi:hypothetical protein
MSGYIEAGYVIALGALGSYALSLVRRERSVRGRLPQARPQAGPPAQPPPSPASEPAEQS